MVNGNVHSREYAIVQNDYYIRNDKLQRKSLVGEVKKKKEYEIKMTEDHCLRCWTGCANTMCRSEVHFQEVTYFFLAIFIRSALFIHTFCIYSFITPYIRSQCDWNTPNHQSTVWSSHTDNSTNFVKWLLFSLPTSCKQKQKELHTAQNVYRDIECSTSHQLFI